MQILMVVVHETMFVDDEALDQDLPDLINDDVEDEGSNDEGDGSVHSGDDTGKRRHRDSDIDEDLEDEDYDLIEENLGVRVDRVSHIVCYEVKLHLCHSCMQTDKVISCRHFHICRCTLEILLKSQNLCIAIFVAIHSLMKSVLGVD